MLFVNAHWSYDKKKYPSARRRFNKNILRMGTNFPPPPPKGVTQYAKFSNTDKNTLYILSSNHHHFNRRHSCLLPNIWQNSKLVRVSVVKIMFYFKSNNNLFNYRLVLIHHLFLFHLCVAVYILLIRL